MSLQAETRKRRVNQQAKPWNTFALQTLIFIIMLAASSCRCRALLVRHERHNAFLSSIIGRARLGKISLLSSHARLQSDDDIEMPRHVARSRPLPPPPVQARRMPPTMESFESSNIYSDFPEFDATAADEYGTTFDYDPSIDGEAYGFFTGQGDYYETEALSFADHAPTLDASKVRLPDHVDTSTPIDATDAIMPPIDDPYMNNLLEEDVPNPHNYWDDDTPAEDEALVKDEPKASAVEAEPTIPTPFPKTKVTPPTSESVNVQVKATFPTRSVPPRSTFASEPPNDRAQVYVMASSGDAITTEVDMLTTQLLQLEQDIYTQNNNKEFNIKSTKQVSLVLFGQPGQATNKETLEAMGGAGNVMADLVLRYRSLSRKIARMNKKKEHKANGTLVRNVSATRRSTAAQNAEKSMTALSNVSDKDVIDGDPLLLLDASAYIFRAYYSMPPLHRADGMPVGAVLGFCNMLNRLVLTRMLNGECPRLVLVFDAKGKNFRHDMYEDYKANRPECPMDLVPQFDLIREAAEAYGIQQLEAPSFEADDVIATLATKALNEGVDANILSGDKDLMQLITPQDVFPAVEMVDPMTMARVSHDVVVEKWGVTPDKLGDVLALAGDLADNVPGVPGIGPKIAAALIGEYGSLEDLLGQVDSVQQKGRREKLKDNMEKARLSRQLVDLERDIPLEKMTFPSNIASVAELRMAPMDAERLLAFYENMGLKDMKRRVEARLDQQKVVRSSRKNYYKRQKAEIPKPDDYKDVPF